MLEKPTKEDVETTKYVLVWLLDYLKENEPGATVTLQAINDVASALPSEGGTFDKEYP